MAGTHTTDGRVTFGMLRERATKNLADRWHDGDRWYNGFSWKQRLAKSRPQIERRRGNAPTVCCMTGSTTKSTYTHLEDYDRPLDWYPMSSNAHTSLHGRFRKPKPWFELVAKHYLHGAWFTLLTMDVRDMYRPYADIYPQGLPAPGEAWPQVADALGISADLFENFDDTEFNVTTISAAWNRIGTFHP